MKTNETTVAAAPKQSNADQVMNVLARLLVEKSHVQNTCGVDIKHDGTQIVLPALPQAMTHQEAIQHLQRIDEMENELVRVHQVIAAFPLDGAIAFGKAMMKLFGWATPKPTRGFFFDIPPATVDVETGPGPNDRTTVIWGQFDIPGIDGELMCGVDRTPDGELVFLIHGEVQRKCVPLIDKLAALTREIVAVESIYKGKAIRLRLDASGKLDAMTQPAFLDLRQKDPLILPELVRAAVDANVFAPVEKSAACRRAGIPLKRGVVLVGPPGTGKTLTAQVLAKKCVDNGWTYILVNDVAALPQTIGFAKRYAPCVLFCEDIDHGTSGPRDAKINQLLNTMDGIASKNAEIMLVFTSNDTAKIERTLVRPGRIDSIIEFPAPQDATTIAAFIRHYGSGTVSPTADLTKACLQLEGAIPAVIREAVERSKLYALSRGVEPENMIISDEDICAAAATMKNHVDFLREKRDMTKSPGDAIAAALATIVEAGFKSHKTEVEEAVAALMGSSPRKMFSRPDSSS